MKTGDIIFVRGTTPLSKLIKWFDNGEFSHVAVAVSGTHIIETQYFTNTRIMKMYHSDYECIRLRLTDRQKELVVIRAQKLLGRKYDYVQVISYVFSSFFSCKHIIINSRNNLICSELVVYILESVGIHIDKNVTPNELYAILKGSEQYGQSYRAIRE